MGRRIAGAKAHEAGQRAGRLADEAAAHGLDRRLLQAAGHEGPAGREQVVRVAREHDAVFLPHFEPAPAVGGDFRQHPLEIAHHAAAARRAAAVGDAQQARLCRLVRRHAHGQFQVEPGQRADEARLAGRELGPMRHLRPPQRRKGGRSAGAGGHVHHVQPLAGQAVAGFAGPKRRQRVLLAVAGEGRDVAGTVQHRAVTERVGDQVAVGTRGVAVDRERPAVGGKFARRRHGIAHLADRIQACCQRGRRRQRRAQLAGDQPRRRGCIRRKAGDEAHLGPAARRDGYFDGERERRVEGVQQALVVGRARRAGCQTIRVADAAGTDEAPAAVLVADQAHYVARRPPRHGRRFPRPAGRAGRSADGCGPAGRPAAPRNACRCVAR